MPDVMTPDQRHKAMGHNRGRTGPERALASALWHRGVRYLTDEGYRKRYHTRLLGHPDLVLPGRRVVVFVDGCFWHGCPDCDTGIAGASEFWHTKIQGNRDRDQNNTRELQAAGWRVIRIPEHSVSTKKTLRDTVDTLLETLMDTRKQTVGTPGPQPKAPSPEDAV